MNKDKLVELFSNIGYKIDVLNDKDFDIFYDGVLEIISDSEIGRSIVSGRNSMTDVEFILVWHIENISPLVVHDAHLLFKHPKREWYEQSWLFIEDDVHDYIRVEEINEAFNQLKENGVITSKKATSDKSYSSHGVCVAPALWNKLTKYEKEETGKIVLAFVREEQNSCDEVYFQDSVSDIIIAKYGTFKTLKVY